MCDKAFNCFKENTNERKIGESIYFNYSHFHERLNRYVNVSALDYKSKVALEILLYL